MDIKFHIKNFYKHFLWHIKYRPRLSKFKNIHKDEDCFIIGNGPSLNKMDLTLLNDYHTFGLNKIYLIFKRVNLNLSYIVATNPLVIEQSKEVFKKMTIPLFLNFFNADYNSDKQNINYFYPYYKTKFEKNLQKKISEGATVTYTTMQIAYYMGFKNIFLIGVDHNFKQKGKANETQLLKEDDVNHFDPNYFKGNQWQLADLEKSEHCYKIAKDTFEDENKHIFDATIDGKLNIFEKISFDEALKMCKKK